ncbi:MAG TPA: hypothetical protein VGG69_07855 [Rhizomicrobium sp.]
MLQPTPLEVRFAASPALLERGSVNVIGFGAIREQAGDRWPKLREGVISRLEGLLRHALRPTDFFAPLDDTTYLVTMPSADPQDVNIVCLRIAYDLHNSLLGRCDLGQIQVSTARSGGVDLLELHPLTTEQILAMAEKAGIHDFAASPYARAAIATKLAAATRQEVRVDLAYSYLPVWDSRNEAITTYLCQSRAYRVLESHAEAMPPEQTTIKERIAIEIAALHAGISELASALRGGQRFLLSLPFSFETIGSPLGRMELTSACRHLLAEHRQYLIFILTGVPPGVAQRRLADLINTMRPFARHVMATVAPGSRAYAAYQGIGLQAIGLEIVQPTLDLRLEADIARLALAAKGAKLGTFLYGLSSADMLGLAHETGIRWLSGPAIAAPVTQPQPMVRLTWDALVAERMAAA